MSIFDPPEVQFAKKLDKNLEELENLNIVGLDEIIYEIKNLKNKNELYKRIVTASKIKKKYASGAKFTRKEAKNINNIMLGFKILGSRHGLYLPPYTDLIKFSHFEALYVFLEVIYYVNLNRRIGYEDAIDIYFSGLAEKIMFALDKFDEIEETPIITDKFFLTLKELEWQDDESKDLYKRLRDSMFFLSETIFGSGFFGGRPGNFGVTEDFFTLFLAACSAINDNRSEINHSDVLRAYKTYFKLLKTDITVYKADPVLARESGFMLNEKIRSGYLVCDKCGGYYELQSGESPEDFDRCQCGGKLEFLESY